MPERPEEWEKAKKENLRYCLKHNRYYDADSGCPDCQVERLEQELKICPGPDCGKRLLLWNPHTCLYKCLGCGLKLSESEYIDSQVKFISEEQE
jgi:hypothetical protein